MPCVNFALLRLAPELQYTYARQVAPKAAAVLVPLFEDAEGIVRVLLTQRSSNLSTHQGNKLLLSCSARILDH